MTPKKSLAWLGSAQAASVILQFASSVVVAHYLTPYEMGIYAAAAATIAIVSLFQQVSLPALIIRERDLTEDIIRTAFTINAILSALLSITIFVLSFAGGYFLRDDRVRHVMMFLSVAPLANIFTFLPATQIERDGQFRTLAIMGTSCAVVTAIIVVVAVINGHSYMSIAYSQIAGIAAYSILGIWFGRKYFRFAFGINSWRRISEFGILSMSVLGAATLSQRLSEIGIGRILGLGSVGIFSRASGLNMLLWNNIHLLVNRVLLVDYASIHREGRSLRTRYILTVSIVTAVLWPAFTGLAVIAKSFLALVYGTQWIPAAGPFRLLAVASIILVSITMTSELCAIKDRMRVQARIEVTRAVVGLIAFLVACQFSLLAAAATRVADALLAWLLYRPHLSQMTDTNFSDLKKVYALSAVLTALAVSPALVAQSVSKGQIVGLPGLMLTVFLGVALWTAGLLAFNHPLGEVLKDLAARASKHVRRLLV